ncbi:uncharacterized protein LOC107475995 isoform X4 [Arachis duranensis]|uniref:Uncharacterized protein LOC107475995 isoform X4 n=1 Tax=Arachis duranensis TaxID=130453 RepID=A0A9C6WEX5_ARADU|nr:uncharacterized protein LOC107475995 isoform X4 [Arachis duranensis]
MISLVKELWRTLLFLFSIQFWRMGLLWTFSIVFSHHQLIKDFFCSQRPKSYYRCSPCVVPVRPVAVVTGNIWPGILYCLRTFQRRICCCAWRKERSKLGIEMRTSKLFRMIGTNYIGAFVLTNLLLPLLESSNVSSRIVNVTSFTHRNVTDMQVDDRTVSGKRFLSYMQYPYANIYEYSKLFLLLFTFELHRQLRLREKSHQIFVAAADPGVVQTNILREVPSLLSLSAHFVLKYLGLLQSPEYGVSSIIDAALAPPGTSGAYFFGGIGRTIEPSILSRDAGLALKLWETTSNLLSTTPFGTEED